MPLTEHGTASAARTLKTRWTSSSKEGAKSVLEDEPASPAVAREESQDQEELSDEEDAESHGRLVFACIP